MWRPLPAAARRRQRLSLFVLGAIVQAQVRAHPLASLVVADTASLPESISLGHIQLGPVGFISTLVVGVAQLIYTYAMWKKLEG